MIEVRARMRVKKPPEIVARKRERPSAPIQARSRQRPPAARQERNVDVSEMIAFGRVQFEQSLPGVRVTCGICKGNDAIGQLMGRVVYRKMDAPCKAFIYDGKGHENDPKSYAMDATKNFEDASALLRRKHVCRGDEKPVAKKTKPKTAPAWATGTDLSKIRKRTR